MIRFLRQWMDDAVPLRRWTLARAIQGGLGRTKTRIAELTFR
jgi:hypothetical protein